MPEFAVVLLGTLLYLGVPVAICLLWDRVRIVRFRRRIRRRYCETPHRIHGTPEYNARFSSPDFSALEEVLDHPLPESFRELYRSTANLPFTPYEFVPPGGGSCEDCSVHYFFPADRDAVNEDWPDELKDGTRLPVAADGYSGAWCLALDEGLAEEAPVYWYHPDGDIWSPVAGSLSEFLSCERIVDPHDLRAYESL